MHLTRKVYRLMENEDECANRLGVLIKQIECSTGNSCCQNGERSGVDFDLGSRSPST